MNDLTKTMNDMARVELIDRGVKLTPEDKLEIELISIELNRGY